MEKEGYLKAKILEKARRVNLKDILLYTKFLTLSEQNDFFKILKDEGFSLLDNSIYEVPYFLYGGYEDSDRKVIFFLPSYIKKEELINDITNNSNIITCLKIEPKNVKFSDTLTHRDILGSLMNLGYSREEFGDILTDGTTSFLYLLKEISSEVINSLTKIKHTDVIIKEISPNECTYRQNFEIKLINISSNRLDAIIAEAFNLSRGKAQEFIEKECVFVNGETKTNNSYVLKNESRVSIRGKGKFIFLEELNQTRKGRIVAKIKKYI